MCLEKTKSVGRSVRNVSRYAYSQETRMAHQDWRLFEYSLPTEWQSIDMLPEECEARDDADLGFSLLASFIFAIPEENSGSAASPCMA